MSIKRLKLEVYQVIKKNAGFQFSVDLYILFCYFDCFAFGSVWKSCLKSTEAHVTELDAIAEVH